MAGVVHNRRRVRDSVVDDIVHLGLIHERTREKGAMGYWEKEEGERADMCTASDPPNTIFCFVVSPFGHLSVIGLKGNLRLEIFTE